LLSGMSSEMIAPPHILYAAAVVSCRARADEARACRKNGGGGDDVAREAR
jgi:hypothetical protein